MAKGTKYDQRFKENAVRYRLDHPEFSLQKAAENLGISDSALKTWMRAARENEGPGIIPAMRRKRLPACSVNSEIQRMLLKS